MYKICDGVTDQWWHDCYWDNQGCPNEEEPEIPDDPVKPDEPAFPYDPTIPIRSQSVSFHDWLLCYRSYPLAGHVKCGDEDGSYRDCYLYGNCSGVLDEKSYNCYILGVGCETLPTVPDEPVTPEEPAITYDPTFPIKSDNSVSFDDWLLCYLAYPLAGHVKCGDEDGSYRDCYLYGNCSGVLDQKSYNCFIKGEGCETEPVVSDEPAIHA